MTVNSKSGQMSMSFTLTYARLSVDEALTGLAFCEALSRGGEFLVHSRHPVTGGELFLARGNLPERTYESPDPRFARLLRQLAIIQQKTGVSFTIPQSPIRFQDANTIAATADIVQTGHAQYSAQPWVSVSNVEQAKSALKRFESEEPIPMALHFEGEVVIVFGVYVPLGPVTLFCERAYITKEDMSALRKDIEGSSPDDSISIRFTPFEGCLIEARYIKWLPENEANDMRQLPMFQKANRHESEGVTNFQQVDTAKAISLLQSWYDDDAEEQRTSWERLKTSLNENRLSDRKLF